MRFSHAMRCNRLHVHCVCVFFFHFHFHFAKTIEEPCKIRLLNHTQLHAAAASKTVHFQALEFAKRAYREERERENEIEYGKRMEKEGRKRLMTYFISAHAHPQSPCLPFLANYFYNADTLSLFYTQKLIIYSVSPS